MKTDRYNVEDLLAEVEHAGRDARRQQELGNMIDQMAVVESRRHGFWWWSARVVAAACFLFFVSTAVRIWFIPTEPTAPMVAEAGVASEQWPVASMDSTVATPAKPAVPRRTHHKTITHPAAIGGTPLQEGTADAAEEEVLPVVEELLAEEVESKEEPVQEVEKFAVEEITAPVVSVAYAEPQPRPQEPARRRNILSGLFRQPEADEMTGTVLAFRIL